MEGAGASVGRVAAECLLGEIVSSLFQRQARVADAADGAGSVAVWRGALDCTRIWTRPVAMARVGAGQGWWRRRRVSGRQRFAERAAADPMQAKSDGLGGLDGCQRR
ncbi:hypothetical protein BM1_01130 [Bipolaris maydis]|nr:hypothetical protein BM1_01130 [Bipolaris maydis]